MNTILIPFDFSKAAINAFHYAIEFAMKEPTISLYLLHLLPEDGDKNEVSDKLDDFIAPYQQPMHPEIKVMIKQGELTPVVLKVREDFQIDLVIIGTRGLSVAREGMSSHTSEFIHDADLPVLVIPVTVKKFHLKTIILTVGKEKIADRKVLYTLLEIARRFGAKVHLLTVDKGAKVMGYSENDESNENTIEYFLEMFYSHHSFMENEDIEQGIKDYLKKHPADMLAIMPKTHLKDGKASEGKLTQVLTLHSHQPLLVLD